MEFILASDPLAPLGQAAGIVLLLYMFVSTLIGIALAFALLLGLAWVRQKVKLVQKLSPMVDSINTIATSALHGTPDTEVRTGRMAQIGHTVENVSARVRSIGPVVQTTQQKVGETSDKVADAVIEFRARTEMAKGMVKAFLLPGLTQRSQRQLEAGHTADHLLPESSPSAEMLAGPDGASAGSMNAVPTTTQQEEELVQVQVKR
jgi:hypothetical protein